VPTSAVDRARITGGDDKLGNNWGTGSPAVQTASGGLGARERTLTHARPRDVGFGS